MTTLKAYMGVARAPFLLLSVVLVAAGAAAALWEGRFSWLATALALIGLVALHAAVDILNEVSDFFTRIDFHTERTPFSGGSGTLPAGEMSPATARAFAVVCLLVGGAIGAWFVVRIGRPLIPVLVIGAVAVLLYTPILARIGLGELFAGLGLGALPVWGASLVQGGSPAAASLVAAVPAFFMTFNLLLLNEFPDQEADRAGGRRNLVHLLGRRTAALVYTAAALAVPVAIIAGVAQHALPALALVAVLPSLLLVKPLTWALGHPQEAVPIPALGANVVWNLATNALLALALAAATALA